MKKKFTTVPQLAIKFFKSLLLLIFFYRGVLQACFRILHKISQNQKQINDPFLTEMKIDRYDDGPFNWYWRMGLLYQLLLLLSGGYFKHIIVFYRQIQRYAAKSISDCHPEVMRPPHRGSKGKGVGCPRCGARFGAPHRTRSEKRAENGLHHTNNDAKNRFFIYYLRVRKSEAWGNFQEGCWIQALQIFNCWKWFSAQ